MILKTATHGPILGCNRAVDAAFAALPESAILRVSGETDTFLVTDAEGIARFAFGSVGSLTIWADGPKAPSITALRYQVGAGAFGTLGSLTARLMEARADARKAAKGSK